MTKAISIFSCAKELHKIAIKRWRIEREQLILSSEDLEGLSIRPVQSNLLLKRTRRRSAAPTSPTGGTRVRKRKKLILSSEGLLGPSAKSRRRPTPEARPPTDQFRSGAYRPAARTATVTSARSQDRGRLRTKQLELERSQSQRRSHRGWRVSTVQGSRGSRTRDTILETWTRYCC